MSRILYIFSLFKVKSQRTFGSKLSDKKLTNLFYIQSNFTKTRINPSDLTYPNLPACPRPQVT